MITVHVFMVEAAGTAPASSLSFGPFHHYNSIYYTTKLSGCKYINRIEFYFLEKIMYRIALLVSLLFVSIAHAEPIVTESTTNSTVTTNGSMETTVKSPPPSAISPQLGANSNSDLCTIGVAGAVQTQILGISAGTTFTEENCLRLKNAKTLYDMGMKVAAVSVMCQDQKVFDAMMMAGTPCPYEGQIGEAAKIGWESHKESQLEKVGAEEKKDVKETATWGIGGLLTFLLLL